MKKFTASIILSLLLFIPAITFAQCSMYPVSLEQRVQQSNIVVEGKVISTRSFWDDSHSMIYTANEVDVYKVFKGNSIDEKIIVVTEGGQVRDEMVIAEPGIQLQVDQAGMFCIHRSGYRISKATGTTDNHELYGGPQGFIQYDIVDRTAHDPFNSYSDIETELYSPVLQYAGQDFFIEKKAVDFFNPGNINGLMPPTISSFSPSPTYAGTLGSNVFTISGTNFGSSYVVGTSKVEFKNANDGGSTYITAPDNHIKTWSSTTITCWIPTGAGKGKIRVTNNLGESVVSASLVTIKYNETNVVSGGTYYKPDLVNDNTSGGYTLVYNTTFNSNTSAVGAFERALETWRCGTFVNFTKSGTTSVAVNVSDGVNVVTFDGSSPLSSGVLGTAYSYYTSCASGVWYLSETDLKFRTDGTGGITWNYGPGATTGGSTDFESVCLHELGHSHQLGHTNLSPVTVMHYSIGTATDRRTLSSGSEDDGGDDIMTRSIVSNSCGPSAMTALTSGTCALSGTAPVADFTASSTSICKNKTINFTDLSTNTPTSWAWTFTGGTPASSTAKNPTGIKYSSIGTFSVTLTATNASGSDSETKTGYITVNAVPTISLSAGPCSASTVLITATASPSTGVTYKWKKDGAAISGATKSTYSATVSGTYNCTVTISATGCKKTSANLVVTVSCKVGEESADQEVTLYPNPSTSSFTIKFYGDENEGRSLRIFDVTGRMVQQTEIPNDATNFTSGENLLPGIYMVELKHQGKSEIMKWIKVVAQ